LQKALVTFIALLLLNQLMGQQSYELSSPDKSIVLRIDVRDSISYSIHLDNKNLVNSSVVAFVTDNIKNSSWKVSKFYRYSKDDILVPVVFQKTDKIRDHFNALRVGFSNGLTLEWRAYDDGIAWQWSVKKGESYKVIDEKAGFNFPKGSRTLYPEEDGFYSHNERKYHNYSLDSIGQKLASLPALFEINGNKVLINEAGLFDYAGMWLKGNSAGGVNAVFPHYPKEKMISGDRDEKVISREDFIAKRSGNGSFPWRIMMIARKDQELMTNQLVYQLAQPSKGDYSWVRPGKVQWDWWHYNNIYGVKFKAGINNDTYKYYIDFASKYGIEYVLLDEGWCDTKDLMAQSPGIDVSELADYAKSKSVGLILWTSWLVLDRQLDTALDLFSKWGIKGIKVDFMQRDDQQMMEYYEKVAKAASSRKLLVDFHGACKPTGFLRTYPNVLTSEGVLGNEMSKFSSLVDPDHTLTIPFIRMAAGPMDFTPGGMNNVQKNEFAAVPSEPMTLGTRCNQMAMYVVFESPLQMLCDIPTHYYKEADCMDFLRSVPVEWRSTIPLEAKIGDYVAIAREAKNGDWYIGAMADWSGHTTTLSLDFLPQGNWKMQIWKDGPNADRNAKDYSMEIMNVTRSSSLPISMAKGGGFVARIEKMK
jgi:alpha-glucosidase